jgi:hypothetical protein
MARPYNNFEYQDLNKVTASHHQKSRISAEPAEAPKFVLTISSLV